GCPLQNVTGVIAVVLEHPGQIDVSWTWPRDDTLLLRIADPRRGIHDLLPVLPVAILNKHRDRRAEGFPGAHTGKELDVVGFDLHPSAAPVALLAARQIDVDIGGDERQASYHSLEYGDQCGAV